MITHMLHFREQIIKIENLLKIEKSLFNQKDKEYLEEPGYLDIDDDSDSDDEDFEQLLQYPHRQFTFVVAIITTLPHHLYNLTLWLQFMTRLSPLIAIKQKVTQQTSFLIHLAKSSQQLRSAQMRNLLNQLSFKSGVLRSSRKDEIKEQITQYLCNLELISQLFDAENPEYLAFIKARSGDDDSVLMSDGEGNDKAEHPHEFLCPISQELMKNPSLTQYGHSYEKRNISIWLKSHDTDPATGVILTDKTLRPNQQLKQAISRYKKEKETATLEV
jgi:hypothetical protein